MFIPWTHFEEEDIHHFRTELKHHALNMKGNALLGLDKSEEAIVWFDKALEVNPNYFFALNNKGLALSNLGRYDEAITSYDKALEINPNYEAAKQNKILALQNLN